MDKFKVVLNDFLITLSNVSVDDFLKVVNKFVFDKEHSFSSEQKEEIVKQVAQGFNVPVRFNKKRTRVLSDVNLKELAKEKEVEVVSPEVEQQEVEVEVEQVVVEDNASTEAVTIEINKEEQNMTNSNATNNTQNKQTIPSFEDFQKTIELSGHTESTLRTAVSNWTVDNGLDAMPTDTPVPEAVYALIVMLINQDMSSKAGELITHILNSGPVAAESNVSNHSGGIPNHLKWVGAGSALLGAGLETFASGEVTIGSAAGAVVGTGLAYWGSEKLAEKVGSESKVINYSMVGTLGLGLGAGGSAAGRFAQSTFFGSSEEEVIEDQGGTSVTIINNRESSPVEDI